ncbi:Opaque-specific ABC transporter CDR3 [Colletotrichum spinosum]|uniref:Opaque-specific ABC transporter CDR3 n=1 Tax=Colletotrichum spinosum TaxID=1347390 RepID=A0A4R8PU19_9PEZI|nr:Opaque-specific ABC transporter CDR3 [Colletotrichum spinosum]
MDPSSPAKRRALAPLDANVNAISPAPKRHNKTPLPNSPVMTSIKSPPGLKRPIAAVVFDENSVVAKKKQCQEPVAAPPPRLVHVPAPVNAPASTPTSAPASAPAPAQRTLEPVQPEEEVDAKEGQTEPQPEKELVESPSVVQSEGKEQHLTRSRAASPSPNVSSVFDSSAMDTSQNTTLLTEPDTEQTRTLPPPRQKRLLTREEARQPTNEFNGVELACVGQFLIPNGPGYGPGLGGQACAGVLGARPGAFIVTGDDYLGALDFSYGHAWRNFGVVCAWYVVYTT